MLLVCNNCGAQEAQRKNKNRFMKRHPTLCNERAENLRKQGEFTKQLSLGTRSVSEDQGEFPDGIPFVEG